MAEARGEGSGGTTVGTAAYLIRWLPRLRDEVTGAVASCVFEMTVYNI